MTSVLSMLDEWAEGLEKGEDNCILILDQSAAYDMICHKKLLEQIKIIGCDTNEIEFFKDYLADRSQTTTVDTFQSDTLMTGPMSVCQGSTLSGFLYMIYTLDYPLIHSNKMLNIQEYDEMNQPKTTTFIDDSIVKILLDKDHSKNNKQVDDVLKK